jgi:hypothetical protein
MNRPKALSSLFVASLLVAVACVAIPRLYPSGDSYLKILTLLWALIVLLGIVFYRVRALWLLIGLPLVLYFWIVPAHPIIN